MKWTEEQMDALVNAVKGLVERSINPVREHVRGLAERADKRYQEISALEKRVAALERQSGKKGGAVSLIKAGDR